MKYSLSHLADHALLKSLFAVLAHVRVAVAELLAHLAEVDERKLYLPAGYPSMFKYCVHELHMSEDTAIRRINVARAAREFPAIFPALAAGRLNLTAVLLLAPHLKPETADELLAAAARKTKDAIRLLLAERFPQSDAPTAIQAIGPVGELAAQPAAAQPALEQVGSPVLQPAPEQVATPRPRVAPLSPGRFALQVTVDQQTHDQLRYAQSLLGHTVPSSDVATVLKRALDALVRDLEKKKFARGVSTRPRGGSKNARYVPAEVRRTVWQRDDGQCTFVSASGKRCEERADLEFDHIEPLARGGRTVASNLRLRCRGHNQYEAERAFGTEFMRAKRDQARRRTELGRARAKSAADTKARSDAAARAAGEAAAAQAAEAAAAEVIPFLLHLGFNAKDARQGAAHAARLTDAPLDQRVRVALQNLAPPCRRILAPGVSAAT